MERKIHDSEEQFRRLKTQRENAEQEMSQMEVQLSTHKEEKEELVSYVFFCPNSILINIFFSHGG